MSSFEVPCSFSALRSTSAVRKLLPLCCWLLRLHQDSVVGVNSVGYLKTRQIVRN